MKIYSLALLVVAAGPAMAGEPTSQSQDTAMFQALSTLSGPGQTALNVMTDDQLAAVEGQRHRRRSVKINVQVAVIQQTNVCVICVAAGEGAFNQANSAAIIQDALNN